MTIVVTGGSGYFGTELTKALLAKQYTVINIDIKGPRIVHQNLFYIPCDIEQNSLPFNVLERTDAVIHLRGTSLHATKHLIASLAQTTNRPSIIISDSSTVFYGSDTEHILDEKSPMGVATSSREVAETETEIMHAEEFGCRVVVLRKGLVLGRGGFLKKLWQLSRFYISTAPKQKSFWTPWVHINDAIRTYFFALETGTLQGEVNVVSPSVIQQGDIMRMFRRVTRSLSLGPVTRFSIKRNTREIQFDQKVTPQKLIDKGFSFAFTEIEAALRELKQYGKD